MNIKFKFIDDDNNVSKRALIQMQLVNDIVNKKIIVSNELLNRCEKIKRKLIEFPDVLKEINNFSELKFAPWFYETLNSVGSFYRYMSSVRLTNKDRLIFDERTEDENEIIIIDEIFHYLKDIKDKNSLIGSNKELYILYAKMYEEILKNNSKLQKLYDISKRNNKIWFL